MRTKTPHLADRILDAAAQLFAQQRFHEVRMDAIAGEATVSKGTLYSYFQDKDELYQALLSRGSAAIIELMERAFEEHRGARAKIVAIVDAILVYFDKEPHLFDLIQVVEVRTDSEAKFPWQQARDVSLRLVYDAFEQGRAEGEFNIHNPELAALLLFGGLRSAIRFGQRPRPRRLAEEIVHSVLHGTTARF